MKLLFYLFKYCYPPVGGTHIRVFHLLKELSKTNEIHLVALCDQDVDREDIRAMSSFCREIHLFKSRSRNSCPLFLQSFIRGIPYKVAFFQAPVALAHLKKLTNEHTFDYLVFDYVFLFDKELAELPVKKCLLAPNLEYVLLQRYLQFGSPVRKIYGGLQWQATRRYEYLCYNKIDLSVFVSKNDEQTVKSVWPDLYTGVVENAIDGDYLRTRRSAMADPPVLIFVGAMWYYPNVQGMLHFLKHIFPEIQIGIPGVRLWIVGENPHRELIRASRNLPVTITGRVPDVRPYIDQASVYILPLRIASGVRYKIFEALSMEIPVVAFADACEGHDLTHQSEAMIAANDVEFAQHVVRLVHDENLWKKISQNGRAHVLSRYSWPKSAANLENLLASVPKSGSAG